MPQSQRSQRPGWAFFALLLGGASLLAACNKDKGAEAGDGTPEGDGDSSVASGGTGAGVGGTDGGGNGTGSASSGGANSGSGGAADPDGSGGNRPGTGGSSSSSGGETGEDGTGGLANGSGGQGSQMPPRKSTGCGSPAPFFGEREFTVTMPTQPGEMADRTYFVVSPEEGEYDPDKPYAVMFVLHGSNGTATPGHYNLANAAGGEAGRNTIYVHPQGILLEGFEGYGNGWNEDCNGYDMPFFDEMLAQVKSDFCVDENRIFAGGFSWGGDFASSLGCCRGDVVRGVIPTNAGERNTGQTGECTEEISAFRISYADNDNVYSAAAFESVVSFFRDAHECSDSFTDGPEPAGTQNGACRTYDNCAKPVIECIYPGIEHSVPNGWGDDVWSFISSF